MEHEKEQVEYEAPKVIDYGTLVEVTRASTFQNADSPAGTNNTAFPVNS
jgi:hypothetical protein